MATSWRSWRAPMLMLPLLAVATGLYNLAPGSGFAIVAIVFSIVAMTPAWRSALALYAPARMVGGMLLFNAVFLLRGVFDALPLRDYLLHVFSLGLFVLAYGAGRLVLAQTAEIRMTRLALPAAGLAMLFAAQLAQAAGWLGELAPPPAIGFLPSLVWRPGGLMNSNATAAIALMLLFVAGLHRQPRLGLGGGVVLMMALTVIAVTQSRAGLLALFLYGAWLLRRQPWRVAGLLGMALGIAAWSGALRDGMLLFELAERFAARFGGDYSSDERAWILVRSFDEIGRAPWFGHGYQYLQRLYGGGSHNTPVELLVSFGFIGALLMGIAGAAMLMPVSLACVCVCVLPSLLFSHNYFDSPSLQVGLALALAADRASMSGAPGPHD